MNSPLRSRQHEFQESIDRVRTIFVQSDGDIDVAQHRNAVAYTESKFGNRLPWADVPQELIAYFDNLALHAYKITDADVEHLQALGYSDDAIFELTVGGAFGAGVATWQKGIDALDSFFTETEAAEIDEGRELHAA